MVRLVDPWQGLMLAHANWQLYRSRHGLLALLLVAVMWVWGFGREFGGRDSDNVNYLLATGWLAALLYVVIALYAVRKAAHRTGLSPEFRRKLPLVQLEAAATALCGLENEVRSGALASRGDVRRRAARVLRQHAVHRVLRASVEFEQGQLVVRALPRDGLGRLAVWMHVHLYYGVAAAVMLFLHGGGRVGSSMGLWLNVLSLLVIGSGIVGIVLWTFGPSWLTQQEHEMSVEQALALDEHYQRKVQQGLDAMPDGSGLPLATETAAIVGAPLASDQRQALGAIGDGSLAVLVEQRRRVRAEWRRLGRARGFLNGWRVVHVPLSALLLVLVVVHVFSIWLY